MSRNTIIPQTGRFLICFIFAFQIFCSQSTQAGSANEQDLQQKDHVCFRWAFGGMIGGAEDRQLIPITHDTILKTGDKLKMLVDLQSVCFVYIFYQSSQNEIYLLFPPKTGTEDYKALKKYYVPKDNQWFELDDHPGREIFYLLVSARQLNQLEALYELYLSSTYSSQKRKRGQQLLAELEKTKRTHRRLTAAAERPVRLGGSVRGIEKEKIEAIHMLDDIAVEISAYDFYSRTFTIDHR
jgi:hypothetical protein